MKITILTFVLAISAGVVTAQTTKSTAPTSKAAPAATKIATATKTTTAKKAVSAKPKAKPLDVAALAVLAPASEAVLGAAELSIAERVYVGKLPCELGNSVELTADVQRPGYFDLQIAKARYRLIPVLTTTGAIRLEDSKSGAVWLQLANKSMLMNHKLGQRMADECMSPQQVTVAEQFKIQPPPSVLEIPAGATLVVQPVPNR